MLAKRSGHITDVRQSGAELGVVLTITDNGDSIGKTFLARRFRQTWSRLSNFLRDLQRR